MANINYIQCAFTSGEVSPQIEGRVDLAKYANSAATLNNVFVRVYGGAYRRPGTYFAEITKLTSNIVRVIPFQFSTEQAYIVEMGHQYFRFYKDSGILNQITGNPVEVTTVYTSSNLFKLQYAQDADTMYITSNDYPIKKLTRSSHYLWSLANVEFTGGPWMPDNLDSGAYIKATSFSIGAATVYASGNAAFVAGHSGSLLKIGTSNGYVRLDTITNTTTASGVVVTALQSASATGYTSDWAFGSWSVANGFPSAVSFFEQRLYFAGTTTEPQTIWGSVPLDYENFTPGSDSDDAVSFTIADNQVNAIRWLAAGKALAIGTLGGNFILSSDTSSGPVTPTNINIKKETTYGSALILPKRIGNAILYVQRNNLTIRELKYNFEEDAQLADDATLLSEHITESGIKDMDYQEAPDGILWCVRNDGKLATMTRLASQDVLAWTRHDTQGSFQSIAVIPNGNEDQVWVVCQRSSASVNAKYIEYFKPFIQPTAQSSSFYVDCGLSYQGTGTYTKTVSGLDHLKGLTVSILGDGAVYPDTVVDTAGAVALSYSCNVIHIGLPYVSKIVTSRLEGGSVTSTFQGIIKRIYKVTLRLWRSLGVKVGNETTQDIVYFRDSSMEMDSPPLLKTGDISIAFPIGYNKDAKITVTQEQPLPLNILGIISKCEISEG
jgi:hypothetical protein